MTQDSATQTALATANEDAAGAAPVENADASIAAWLEHVCAAQPRIEAGVVARGEGLPEDFVIAASYPALYSISAELQSLLRRAARENRALAQKSGQSGALTLAARPVLLDGEVRGSVAFILREPTNDEVRAFMRQVQWDLANLREALATVSPEAKARYRASAALQLVFTAVEGKDLSDTARAVATELAQIMGAERVSIGMARGEKFHILGVSHTSSFKDAFSAVKSLADVMRECADQRLTIIFPGAEVAEPGLNFAHEAHVKEAGDTRLLSTPLLLGEQVWGALVVERRIDDRFLPEDVDLARAVASMLAPMLDLVRASHESVGAIAWTRFNSEVSRLIGPEHYRRKVAAIALVMLAVLAWFVRADYTIKGDVRVAGRIERALVAPFDGYILEAPARAGDIVEQGQLLARLDDRDLQLERLNWEAERRERQLEYNEALSNNARGDAAVLGARVEQADIQIQLVDTQIERARIVAPIDGLIVAGDLSQSVGAATRRGDVLFEIAPADGFRAIILVDERDLDAVPLGGSGRIVLSALPDQPIDFAVERITPVTTASDGANRFRVEATLVGDIGAVRPNMEGVAKVDAGQRRIVWIWTHRLIDWLKLKFWAWSV